MQTAAIDLSDRGPEGRDERRAMVLRARLPPVEGPGARLRSGWLVGDPSAVAAREPDDGAVRRGRAGGHRRAGGGVRGRDRHHHRAPLQRRLLRRDPRLLQHKGDGVGLPAPVLRAAGCREPDGFIKDVERTPFNVGRRINLADFSFEEARALATGLHTDPACGEALLRRALHWTDGHPYLTQKLCAALEVQIATPDAAVDAIVTREFLAAGKTRSEEHLRSIHARLAEAPRHRRAMLKAYARIRRGKRVADRPQSAVLSTLKLSGLVKTDDEGCLVVRNRIYGAVFDARWIQKSMPADWNRRLAIAAVVVLAVILEGLLPQIYIAQINGAVDDVPEAAYRTLRRFPGYGGYAEELLARYWDRRAQRSELEGQREGGCCTACRR